MNINVIDAHYSIVEINEKLRFVLIRDQHGPKTVTNDVECVVKHLMSVLRKKIYLYLDDVPNYRIFYIDSSNYIDEIKTSHGEFSKFEIHSFKTVDVLKNYLGEENGI